jgi:CubicO group peptidase (beta-lactamase class C family)
VTAARHTGVQGYVSKGFEGVRDAFLENFSHRKELGAACCVYREGEKVVDLWGGIRNKATGERWEEDTMVLVYSATKGFAAMTLALAHSRGWLDYEERVCTYWPEFAVGTARSMARAYSVFATGGRELQLRPETLQALIAPAVPAESGFYDECMKGEMRYSLGFFKPGPTLPFGQPGSFGAPGAGGSFAFADPQAGIGYAYVTNRMGTALTGDPRDLALRTAIPSRAIERAAAAAWATSA